MQSQQARRDEPLDREHLRRMALGDLALEREVLEMFVAQASRLVDAGALADASAKEASVMAHTLKGSAQSIGAFGVADHAAALEAALQRGEEPTQALAGLRDAVAQARTAIEAILRNSR
jgi:HPt (histidine-containing phosphotransfer) domain-containing protein